MRYYRHVNLRTEGRNEEKIPDSDENEGIKMMSLLILSFIENDNNLITSNLSITS